MGTMARINVGKLGLPPLKAKNGAGIYLHGPICWPPLNVHFIFKLGSPIYEP